jgi:GPI transamidase subunit PIG-U
MNGQNYSLLFGAAAAARLLLFTAFPSLPDVLTGRVEISTPVTSFKRRKYTVWLVFSALMFHSSRRSFPVHAQRLSL